MILEHYTGRVFFDIITFNIFSSVSESFQAPGRKHNVQHKYVFYRFFLNVNRGTQNDLNIQMLDGGGGDRRQESGEKTVFITKQTTIYYSPEKIIYIFPLV